MAEQDDASKTEDPTAKKLSKGREEGNVAASQEIRHWGLLLASAFAVVLFAPWTMGRVAHLSSVFIAETHQLATDDGSLQRLTADVLLRIGVITAPIFVLLLIATIVSNVGQTGFVYSPKKLAPKLARFSPIEGAKRIFSGRALVEFAKGILKLVLVSVVAFGLAIPMLGDIELMPGFELVHTLKRLHEIAIALLIATVAVMTVIGVLDFAYQKFVFLKQMRMTKQEVKDEHRQSEGDPLVRSRIRRLRTERARQRMMQAVPRADVVVTNPTHYAVALEYKMESMPAPKLIAKGVDVLALKIREIAEANDIPVVENPPLARALHATVDLDEEIPPEHYKAVAEVIGYVMRLKGKLPGVAGQPR